ncbi:Bowman-Birk type wound-induced proteinase inhibitor WIP1 [Balamuthia mandrillaris]
MSRTLVLFCVCVSLPLLALGACPYMRMQQVGKAPELCPDGSFPVQCFINPCDVAPPEECPEARYAECKPDYCGGCFRHYYRDGELICEEPQAAGSTLTARRPAICPDGSEPVNCLVDPCSNPPPEDCPLAQYAECRADYCGGCNRRYFIGKAQVCNERGLCPDGSEPVNCLVNPCSNPPPEDCPLAKYAECVPNYCGGCFRNYISHGMEVCDDPNLGLCPDGSAPVNCLVDPCSLPPPSDCPEAAEAKCVANYCGGCNRDYFIDGKQVCASSCDGDGDGHGGSSSSDDNVLCPDGSQPVNCLVDPCSLPPPVEQCPISQYAACRSNYCGGCNREYYVRGERVCTDVEEVMGGDKNNQQQEMEESGNVSALFHSLFGWM